MTNLQNRIEHFDFDNATPHDLAVLLEQVFLYRDDRSRDGGPIIVAQDVLRRFEESARRRAAPELHSKTSVYLRELRSNVIQMESTLRSFERDSSSK